MAANGARLGGMAFHHVAIASRDLEATHRFYSEAMGFELVKVDTIPYMEKGWARHLFYDTGNGELLAIWDLHDENLPDFDPAISTGLGLPNFVNHIAFDAADLEATRRGPQTAGSPTATTSCGSITGGASRSTPTTRAGRWSSSARSTRVLDDDDRREALRVGARGRAGDQPRTNRRSSSSKRHATTPASRSAASSAAVARGKLTQHVVGVGAERGTDVRGSRPAYAPNFGTTPAIGTSARTRAARRTIMSRAAMCGSVARSGAALMSPTGTSCARSSVEERVGGERGRPRRDLFVELVLAGRACFVRREIAREIGALHRVTQPREHRVGVARDHDVVAVGGRDTRSRARRRGRIPPLRRADLAAEFVVGDRRFHQREHRFVDRDVDLLALPAAVAFVQRGERADRPRTTRRASRRSRCPVRAGGRSGSPVVCRIPPIASPIEPKPGSLARGPVCPKPETCTSTTPGFAAASVA